jgi:hypothetical protein
MREQGIIAATTEALLEWVGGTGLTVAPGPPRAEPDTPTGPDAQVYLWLLALLPEQELRPGSGAGVVRLRLRYLLSAGRADDLTSLDRLLQATVGSPYPAVFEPIPSRLWQAVGAAPRPAFFVDVVGHLDRPRPAPPRVTEPLRLQAVPMRALPGTVLGPGDVPLAGMRVETADGLAAADTDHAGRFVLPGLPGVPGGAPLALRLSGRGRQFHHQVPADGPVPVVIRCEFRED